MASPAYLVFSVIAMNFLSVYILYFPASLLLITFEWMLYIIDLTF